MPQEAVRFNYHGALSWKIRPSHLSPAVSLPQNSLVKTTVILITCSKRKPSYVNGCVSAQQNPKVKKEEAT